jgi:hypothetical protein
VTIEGNDVAIRGASFGSSGDIASKGTGGGIVSSNCEGPTKFVGPGSLDVQIEGKNVQLLGDPMLNNCGAGGSPPNAATMTGVIQAPGSLAIFYGDDSKCPKCHRTHEGIAASPEIKASMSQVFDSLKNALAKQRADVARLSKLKKSGSTLEASRLYAPIDPIAVLRFDRKGTKTFSRGYMVGVVICKRGGKKLVSCSGAATPGFLAAVRGSSFTYVGGTAGGGGSSNVVGKWECAAKYLFENLDGHEPKVMIERWFSPHIAGVISWSDTPRVSVTFAVKGIDRTKRIKTQRFAYGETVPSCEKCQARLPEKVCGNQCTE